LSAASKISFQSETPPVRRFFGGLGAGRLLPPEAAKWRRGRDTGPFVLKMPLPPPEKPPTTSAITVQSYHGIKAPAKTFFLL